MGPPFQMDLPYKDCQIFEISKKKKKNTFAATISVFVFEACF